MSAASLHEGSAQQSSRRNALDPTVAQCNMSYNHRRGTLRGLHYETTGATKFIRCLRGAIYDVITDMRPDSPTFRKHFGIDYRTRTAGPCLCLPCVAMGIRRLPTALR